MATEGGSATWINLLKVLAAIAVMVSAVGFALWYAEQQPYSSPALDAAVETVRKENPNAASNDTGGWGIVHDSPIKR